MKKVVVVHMGGNANVRAALNGMEKSGLLLKYITSLAVFSSSWYFPFFKIGILSQFIRRVYDEKIKGKTKSAPLILLGRLFSEKFLCGVFTKKESSLLSVDSERKYIDRVGANYISNYASSISAVYGYEDMSCECFIKAKRIGNIKCIYEEPTGYWRSKERLLEGEKDINPEWATTIKGLFDSQDKLQRKDKEIELADAIITASTFTKRTLMDYPGVLPPVYVIPYGFPPINNERVYESLANRKIRALYVGTLYQQKGLSYMLEAWDSYKENIELSIAGTGDVDQCPILKEWLSKTNYLGRMTHEEIIKYMATQDLLIFPSLFDGFGLVVTEAMSQGTPCIASNCSCGPDVITDGYDGWVVEAGSTKSIKQVFQSIVNNPEVLHVMGRRAMLKAERRPWGLYEKELIHTIKDIIAN